VWSIPAWGLACVAIASPIGLAAVPAVAQAAPITQCGNYDSRFGVLNSPAGIINLTTRQVGCGRAYLFSRQVTARTAFWMSEMSYLGFKCRFTQLQPELSDTRCVNGGQVIHWQTGV
jgi:hypothetical protein